MKKPDFRIKQLKQDLDMFYNRLEIKIKHVLEIQDQKLKFLSGKLHVLSPLAIMERGYSVVYKKPEGLIMKKSKDVKNGDNIEIKLFKGKIKAEIKDIIE